MKYQISTTQWLELDSKTRTNIAGIFGLVRGAGSKVFGSRIISDGYTNENLQGISVEKINTQMGTSFKEEEILKAFYEFVVWLKEDKKIINNNHQDNGTKEQSSKEQGAISSGNERETGNNQNDGTSGIDSKSSMENISTDSSEGDSEIGQRGKDVKSIESNNAGSNTDISIKGKNKGVGTSKIS